MDLLKLFSAFAMLEQTTEGKKRAISHIPGIILPDDFDQLPEAEKERRLNAAIAIGLDRDELPGGKPKKRNKKTKN